MPLSSSPPLLPHCSSAGIYDSSSSISRCRECPEECRTPNSASPSGTETRHPWSRATLEAGRATRKASERRGAHALIGDFSIWEKSTGTVRDYVVRVSSLAAVAHKKACVEPCLARFVRLCATLTTTRPDTGLRQARAKRQGDTPVRLRPPHRAPHI